MAPPDAYDGLVCGADLRRIAGLLGGAAVSMLIPQRMDSAAASTIQALMAQLSPSTRRRIAGRMRRTLPPDPSFDADAAADAFLRMFVEDAWGHSRGVRRFGWNPEVRVEGMERLDAALARGRGAILWSLRFASATAIKQAFHRAGRPLTHLSRAEHGSPSRTRVGVEVAAALYCRAENPYLAERVVIPLDRSLGYLKNLRKRLGANATVSIFAEHKGRQNIRRPVLTTEIEFAIGAPSLAWSEEAALLTVSAHREGPFRYRIEIADEIPVDRSVPRKEFNELAVSELVRRLERLILETPADWQGWMIREFP